MSKTPHKHAELIKAWADGEGIEFNDGGEWLMVKRPAWDNELEYRIKPEPKPDVVKYAYVGADGSSHHIDGINSCRVDNKTHVNGFSGSYKVCGVIAITFDGESGALKSAEVIK